MNIDSVETKECDLRYFISAIGGTSSDLSLCWFVTISNSSDSRISIVDARLEFDLVGNQIRGTIHAPGQNWPIENVDGTPISLPVSLDTGESKFFITRASIDIPPNVAKIIQEAAQLASLDKAKLSDVESLLYENHLEIDGSDPGTINATERTVNVTIKTISVATLVVKTGRGKQFRARLDKNIVHLRN